VLKSHERIFELPIQFVHASLGLNESELKINLNYVIFWRISNGMKLLSLTLGTLLIAFILFMTVRMWGEGQTYKPYDAPFFRGNTPYVIVGWEQNFLIEKKPDLILWVDVYRSKISENLLVKPWTDRKKAVKDLEQIPTPARPLLKDLLLKFPTSRFVINCNENVQDIHKQLVQTIEEARATERVMLQSEYNTILISAKELNPLLVFGSTIADITRLKTFDSMWLLPAAPFKTDVLFTPLSFRHRDMINRDIAQEMKKRFKKVIIGPLATKEEVEKAREFEPDGFFVEDPFLILEK
jgi:hypothetical protein